MAVSKSLVLLLRQVSRAGVYLRPPKCHQHFHTVNRCSPGGFIGTLRTLSIHETTFLSIAEAPRQFLRGLTDEKTKDEPQKPPEKPGLLKRFKQMYKDYWYVLVPVHVVTSCVWFGSFYYASSSGVDIAAVLEWLNLSDSIVEKFKKGANTMAGHLAVSYLLYKVFTPLRYTVTLGGTTYAINFLSQKGYIKSVPSTGDIKQMIKKKTESIREKREQKKKS